MRRRTALFWPGDGREVPNDLARPHVQAATQQMMAALRALGRDPYVVEGFVSKPHESIERLRPIEDPMVAICVHWFYATHTTTGVDGTENPLLLASNFDGRWPGLVGLLNTSASLEMLDRSHSRIWTSHGCFSEDDRFMDRLAAWCDTGTIDYGRFEQRPGRRIAPAAAAAAAAVAASIRKRPVLILMLGDTSMGMINGYFGPRLLQRHGFCEHKVDQAWILDRGTRIASSRIDDALKFVRDKGVAFHWGEEGAADFDEDATREQLRDYLAVLDLVREYKADCIGWQYQLGLIPLRPPSDFAEGLLNSVCRPESNGDTIVCGTEADQGNIVPMELMKRLLKARGLHQATFFHDLRWGADWEGRFVWVLLNSGSSGAYAFSQRADTLRGVHSHRQPSLYFPKPGGTFTGESLPGRMTWARAYQRAGTLWMDVGRGEVLSLPADVRDRWWAGTTREWPFMAADLGLPRDILMAHYQSNHIAVAYGDILEEMIALSGALGFSVRVLSD